jgi:hypothetical protein
MQPLLDEIIERLGNGLDEQSLDTADERPWSPL